MKEELLSYLINEIIEEDVELSTSENLLATGLLDSLAIVRYIQWMSERYSVDIPPQDMTIENFISIDAISNYLKSQGATA